MAEKNVEHELRHVDLVETGRYQTVTPEFLAVNPGATVPVLLHDGHPVYESTEQVRYVDEVVGGDDAVRLTPPSLADEVAAWVDRNSLEGFGVLRTKSTVASMAKRFGNCVPGLTMPLFATMIQEVPVSEISYGLLRHPDRKRPAMFLLMRTAGARSLRFPLLRSLIARSRAAARAHLVAINAELSDGREYLLTGADSFTLADVGLAPILHRLDLAGYGWLWEDLPRLTAWWERTRARPSYRTAVLDVETDVVRRGAERLRTWRKEMPWLRELLDGGD